MPVNCGCSALLRRYGHSKWFKGSEYGNGYEASVPCRYHIEYRYGNVVCLVLVPFLVCHLAKIYALKTSRRSLCVSHSLWSGLSMDMRIAVAHIHCRCVVLLVLYRGKWKLNPDEPAVLTTGSQSHKGKSFKTAFVWMNANLPILSAALQTHTHTHIQSNIAVAFWNASFIHIVLPNQISRLHWIFMKVHCIASHWIGLDWIEFCHWHNTQKRQFTHEFVCFWCINNFLHALLPTWFDSFASPLLSLSPSLRLPHTLRYCFMFSVYAKMHTCHMLTQTLCGDCIDFEWELTSTLGVCMCASCDLFPLRFTGSVNCFLD